jgi:hypothetical protein
MLTDDEVNAAVRAWAAKPTKGKAATAKKADRLRAGAHAAPPFHFKYLETWRLGSQHLSEQLFDSCDVICEGEGAPAIEVAILEKLFSSPKVKAWESAYRVIHAGLNDPHIAAHAETHALFSDLLVAMGEAADDVSNPGIVDFYLVKPETEKALVRSHARAHGMKPHANHQKAARRLPGMWAEQKAAGKTKNEAAPLIANRLGLAESTVRRKLQGL